VRIPTYQKRDMGHPAPGDHEFATVSWRRSRSRTHVAIKLHHEWGTRLFDNMFGEDQSLFAGDFVALLFKHGGDALFADQVPRADRHKTDAVSFE
jgi:hypothetical protein